MSRLSRPTFLPLVALLALAVPLSGCTLLGLGAATVGGCALLDADDDDRVTEAELSSGLFDAWDANDDGTLAEAEFDAGVERRAIFDDWSDEFDDWDENDDDALTEAEFEAGVAADDDTAAWMDRQCDDLGL